MKFFLRFLKEVRTGNEADSGDKEHQAEIFYDLQRLGGVAAAVREAQGRLQVFIEQRAKQQGDDEHARGPQVDALDGDAAQQIAHHGEWP